MWLKIQKLFQILRTYDKDLCNLQLQIKRLEDDLSKAEAVIKERTNLAVDINFKSSNKVIVIGRYNNTDYIQMYNLHDRAFHKIVDTAKSMTKFGDVTHIDTVPNFKASFLREVK